MFLKLLNRVASLPLWIHAAATVATVAAFEWTRGWHEASYAASRHPVDFATGQTAFSGEKIKTYFAHMQKAGTLDVYWTTQVIDYGFILAIAGMGLFVCTFVARFSRGGSWGRRLGLLAGAAVVLGAACDAIENVWSFVMLADPAGFADWLAVPYSAFASLKFAAIALGMVAAIGSLAAGAVGRVLKRPLLG